MVPAVFTQTPEATHSGDKLLVTVTTSFLSGDKVKVAAQEHTFSRCNSIDVSGRTTNRNGIQASFRTDGKAAGYTATAHDYPDWHGGWPTGT